MSKENAENFNEKERAGTVGEDSEITRRKFLKKTLYGTAGAILACSGLEKAFAQEAVEFPSRYKKHGWHYALEEMEEIYNREYNGEKILKNVFRKDGENWIGVVGNEEMIIPRAFIDKTIANFKEMLEKGLVKYIHRLDCSHAHFFVNEKSYESEYKSLARAEIAKKLVSDDSLGALFHNGEHLKIDGSREAEALYKKRNLVCWYNNKPLEILPFPKGKVSKADTPGHEIFCPNFAVHKDGAFSVVANGKEIKFDISFDDNEYF